MTIEAIIEANSALIDARKPPPRPTLTHWQARHRQMGFHFRGFHGPGACGDGGCIRDGCREYQAARRAKEQR